MSAATLGAGRPLPSATWRTAAWLLGNTLRIVAVVAPLALFGWIGVAPAVAAQFDVASPGSLWSYVADQSIGLFTLVIAAMTMGHLATHLAFGMTRRSFAAAVVLTVFVTAGVLALVASLGYLLEAVHYRAYGWVHDAPEASASTLFASLLRTSVWGLAGALTAAIWYRFGAFAGVAAAPFTGLIPISWAAVWTARSSSFGIAEVGMLLGSIALLAVAFAVVVAGVAVRARTG
jgi:hypothetical protein